MRWDAGCTFLDYDRDGHLDLFVCNYVQLDPATLFKSTATVYPEIGGHEIGQPYKNPRLVDKNMGNGQFRDVSSTMDPGTPNVFPAAALLSAITTTMATSTH